MMETRARLLRMSSPTPDEQRANVRRDVPAHVRSATSEMTAETPRTSSETFRAIPGL